MPTQTNWTVDTDSGESPDYTSLNAWENDTTNVKHDCVTNDLWHNVACYATSGAADTASVDWTGWDTSPTQYIRLYTPAATPGGRHDGKWTTDTYRLEVTNVQTSMNIRYNSGADHMIMDGMQFGYISTYRTSGFLVLCDSTGDADAYYKIFSCVFKGTFSSTSANLSLLQCNRTDPDYFIINCTFHGANGGSGSHTGVELGVSSAPEVYMYNCTIRDCDTGLSRTSGNARAKNVAINDCDTACFSGTPHGDSTNNASDDSTEWGTPSNSGEITFVDEGNDDLHLASGDTICRGNGTDLSADSDFSFSDDIDGDTRSAWDIGSDEFVSAAVRRVMVVS